MGISNQAVARHMTRAEWLANDRAAASNPRPFPRIVRSVCKPDCRDGFFQTVDGRWWVLNQQVGYVECAKDSRALQHTLASCGVRQ